MKSLYVCEKCGKMFNDFCAAMDCENSHLHPIDAYDDYYKDLVSKCEYDEGSRIPKKVVLHFIFGEDEEDYFVAYEKKEFINKELFKKDSYYYKKEEEENEAE